jgi:hypothetical protein
LKHLQNLVLPSEDILALLETFIVLLRRDWQAMFGQCDARLHCQELPGPSDLTAADKPAFDA